MEKWIKCKISDIGKVVGGATPSTDELENYKDGTIPWITPKDLSKLKGRYIKYGERNITKYGLKSCSAQILPKNTILFSSRAPIGYIAITENEVCTNQGFKSIIPNSNIDSLFLFYILKYNKKSIENAGGGTTFKEISGSVMKSIAIEIPNSIKQQRKIANILDVLDKKIELNNTINDNLSYQSHIVA